MTKKLVKFSVTSYEGHSEFSLLPAEALKKIKEIEKEQNKWVFIDNVHKNTEFLTEADLLGANDIMLVGALAGGNCCNSAPEKVVKIEFSVVEKQKEAVAVSLVENDYAKEISVSVPKGQLIDVLHSRALIVKAIERKLDEFAEREVKGLKTALNVE